MLVMKSTAKIMNNLKFSKQKLLNRTQSAILEGKLEGKHERKEH